MWNILPPVPSYPVGHSEIIMYCRSVSRILCVAADCWWVVTARELQDFKSGYFLLGDFSLDEKGRWATHCIRVETLQAEVNGAEVSEALIPGQLLCCSELLKCDQALNLMRPIILSLKWHYFGKSTTQSIKVSRHWLPKPWKENGYLRGRTN